jgi:ABC-type nitrate/sulfonate/bicarbonate transport system permease component
MVGVFTIGLIGLLIDKGLLYVQNKILWWDAKK